MRSSIPEEIDVGIEEFYTNKKGIGGKLRLLVEDFNVTEVPLELPMDSNGEHVILEVISKNWETNLLVREIAHHLHISRSRIGFAGIKDRRAVSKQFISVYYPESNLPDINIKNAKLRMAYRSNKRLRIGDLKGNRFLINIRNISGNKEIVERTLEDIERDIDSISGFPNFYGIQRFGVIRPITHLVGKQIVMGDFEKAVKIYVTHIGKYEDKNSLVARKKASQEERLSEAISYFPANLSFENTILNSLKVNEGYISALQSLPKNLLILFVHAYQSYLFNRILSMRIRRGLPINKAIPGDIITTNDKNREYIPVNNRNLEKVNKAILRGKAAVSGAIFGYETPLADGEMGEIERKIIEEEKMDRRYFIIPEIPFLSSSGSRRNILAPIKDLKWNVENDEINKDKYVVRMGFYLEKGCYATSLLREFMKADKITDY